MSGPPRQYYDDGLIQLDREALTLRRYHFPSGTSKIVPVRAIRGYRVEPLWLADTALPDSGAVPTCGAGCRWMSAGR